MEQLNNTANNSYQNNTELPKNNSNTSPRSKNIIFIALGSVMVVVLALSIFSLIRFRNTPSVQKYSSKSTAQPTPKQDSMSIIFPMSNENFSRVRSVPGRRLFIETNDTASRAKSTVVYVKMLSILPSEFDVMKFAERSGFRPAADVLHAHSEDEIHFLGQSFDKYLYKQIHSPGYDIIEQIKHEQYQLALPNITEKNIDLLHTYYPDPEDFAPDKKFFAFITYVIEGSIEEYSKLGLEADKLYIQEIETDRHIAYDLPEGAANWGIAGWSSDGKKIYLTRSYYEAHSPVADGLIIFDVGTGSVNRIEKADKLQYPLLYDSKHELFYGLESNQKFENLIPPTSLWRIDTKSGSVVKIFASSEENIIIDKLFDNGTLIVSTGKWDTELQRITVITGLWLITVEAVIPEQISIDNLHKSEIGCLGIYDCNINTRYLTISADSKFIVWIEDSTVWVQGVKGGAYKAVDLTKIIHSFKKEELEKQLNGMVIF